MSNIKEILKWLTDIDFKAQSPPWRACPVNREEMQCCPCLSVHFEHGWGLSHWTSEMGGDRAPKDIPPDERRMIAANIDVAAAARNALRPSTWLLQQFLEHRALIARGPTDHSPEAAKKHAAEVAEKDRWIGCAIEKFERDLSECMEDAKPYKSEIPV